MTTVDVAAIYARFFELGGPPKGTKKPWHYRRRVTSMRLPGCELLARLVREERPRRILDMGSGMTSMVLRSLGPEVGAEVTTTDTSAHWLKVTRLELERDGLDSDRMYVHDEFDRLGQLVGHFDLVCVDAGDTAFRVSQAPNIARWTAIRGLVVLDDYNLNNFGSRITQALDFYGFEVTPRPESLDEYGNMLATARRRLTP